MTSSVRCLVVDPESSGLDLVAALRARGVDVHTYDQVHPFVLDAADSTSRPEDGLIRVGEACRPTHVLAGSESSVSAAEWLAHHLGLPGSPLSSAFSRRNKDGMMQRVRRAGLAHVRSMAVSSVDEVRQRAAEVRFPAFVKPAASAGSDRCRAVASWSELERAVEAVLTSDPIMGVGNEAAVVQDFIDGPQFFVNAVTVAGEHVVTDVFDYRLRVVEGAPQLYAGRSHRLRAPEVTEIVGYVLRCLDALEVKEGASHTEVRLSGRGPVLIELNARLMGPMQPSDVYVTAQGFSQAMVWAAAVTDGVDAARRLVGERVHHDCIGWFLLSASCSGVLRGVDRGLIEALPTFAGLHGVPRLGELIVTENRVTTADLGMVYLVDRDARRVEADLEALTQYEADGALLEIEPCAPGTSRDNLQGC